MILLVSRVALGQELAAWVSQQTGIALHSAATLEEASQWLHTAACPVAVIDAGFLETDLKAVDHLLSENPALVPVFPNLAVCGPERLVCEIKAALRRGEKERQRADDCARREFSVHLKNSLTAVLLNCDFAQQVPELPVEASEKLLLLHSLASKMRDQLEGQVGQAASA
jgi:hypothetical protein